MGWNEEGTFVKSVPQPTEAYLASGPTINNALSGWSAKTFMKSAAAPAASVTTAYWYSDADIVYINEDSNRTFVVDAA